MGNVTKQYIRDTCVVQLIADAVTKTNVARVTPGNDTTDQALAQAAGIPLMDPIYNMGTYWRPVSWDQDTDPYGTANVLSLYNTNVVGSEIEASLKELMTVLSRVRRVYFAKTQTYNKVGNLGDVWTGIWVDPYYRYGYAYTAALDSSHWRPATYEQLFDGLDAGDNIDQAYWDGLLVWLRGVLQNNYEILTYSVSYCHYSCHNSCHSSRGRR